MLSNVLLLGADYYGTLAAVRAYGRAGIPVTVADENIKARAFASRYATSTLVHPPLARPEELVDWLLAYGEKHPGTLLYPPNDHFCWLFAAEAPRLAKVFGMFCPGEEAILTLLDKMRLHEACAAVGIEVPETHGLAGPEADGLAARLRYPVLLKPRTQVFLESGVKGLIVPDRAALAKELARYRQLVRFHRVLTDRHPEIEEPMVQEYLPAAETSIFSVSGFVGKDGTMVARAAMKVLQRPRKIGIGLCFEGRELEPSLVAKLGALCQKVGYYGTFEAEFIATGDRHLLIDFNPRFYSQMGFDIARGASLPMLIWHATRGDDVALAKEIERAHAWRSSGREVYCHKTLLDLVLTLQGLSGEMSRDEVRGWRRWYADHREAATDAVRDPDDRKPAVVDAVSWGRTFLRHPRAFVRSFVLNR